MWWLGGLWCLGSDKRSGIVLSTNFSSDLLWIDLDELNAVFFFKASQWFSDMNKPKIIAIAGGKGGVGKTLLTANLAMALAQLGKKTIAIDLDLGGSNLHSCLGLPNKHPGVGDYLIAKYGRLEDFLLPTSVENLQFIPGDGRTPCMANIAFAEKVRLLLAIRWLKADYILLDLSGGSSYNTLDFFALAPQGMLVTTLEYTAIMNMLVFLRNFIFRTLDRDLRNHEGVSDLIQQMRAIPTHQGQATTNQILQRLDQMNPQAGAEARKLLERYCPRVVYNFCLLPEQLQVCRKIDQSAQNLLSMNLQHFSSIFEDRTAREAAFRNVPLLLNYPDSVISQRIGLIAQNLIDHWEAQPDDSATRLIEETRQFHQTLSH